MFRQSEQRTRDVYELKRLQAVRWYGTGAAMTDILHRVACGESSVRQWAQPYRQQALDGLKSPWRGDNALKLSCQQRADLQARLHQ